MRRPLRFGLFVPQGWILDLVAISDPVEQFEALVRVTQRAKGSKRLLPFTRSADYRYRPKASAARRI